MSFSVAAAASAVACRPAVEADVAFLLDLRLRAMDAHHRAAGIAQDRAENERRVRERYDCASIVEVDGRPVGVLKVLREPREWRIMQVQLVPEVQRAGIGARLLGALVAQAEAAGVVLTLSVLKGNPARRLYERLGFGVVSEHENGYQMRAERLSPAIAPG